MSDLPVNEQSPLLPKAVNVQGVASQQGPGSCVENDRSIPPAIQIEEPSATRLTLTFGSLCVGRKHGSM